MSFASRIKRRIQMLLYRAAVPGVTVRIVDGKLQGKAHGIRGLYFQPFVNFFVERLNRAKVIAEVGGAKAFTLYNPPLPSKAGLQAMDARIRERFFGIRTPTTATLSLTVRCQCRCVHCGSDNFKAAGKKEVTTGEVKRVIDQALALGVCNIVFTGGEPMLREDLCDLVVHVDKDRAQAMMFTNGFALTEENVRRLRGAGLHALNISIDSPDAAIHDRLRALPGCFAKAMEGAARARRAGILTGISTYATAKNIRDGSLERILEIGRREGFHEVTIFDCLPAGKWLRSSALLLKQEEREAIIALARKYVEMPHPMGVIAQSWINSPRGTGCFGGFYQFYMTAFGDINPCDFNPITFGNIRDASVGEIWEKMTSHPEYRGRKMTCRIQNPAYREKYLDPLPENIPFPVPAEFFETRR
jgi:MoaA/NifB/PqqE/SkfB family radical SAM enzyme